MPALCTVRGLRRGSDGSSGKAQKEARALTLTTVTSLWIGRISATPPLSLELSADESAEDDPHGGGRDGAAHDAGRARVGWLDSEPCPGGPRSVLLLPAPPLLCGGARVYISLCSIGRRR